MDRLSRVCGIIQPSVEAMGYDLVRVQFSGGMRPVLQVMVERVDRIAMTVKDCARISRALSALLDVEDPIEGHYTLEVSSPGIDRPLTRLADFERFAGFEAKVELRGMIDGRKRFRARIEGVEGETVRLLVDGETGPAPVGVPFGEIAKAKLVLTDELIAASGGTG